MSQINQIHTSCKNCAFAQYDNNTQTGCAINYIEKYKNKQCEILEAYDNDKEFYIINNKKCLGYRENKWFTQFNLDNSSLDKKIQKFLELNSIQYLMMVDLKYFSEADFEQLGKIIHECTIQPAKIVFVRYQNAATKFIYNDIKALLDTYNLKCQWRIQTMVDDTLSHKDIRHNCCNLNKGYRFMLSIQKPCYNICKVLDKANSIVYEDLDPIVAVATKDKSATIFSAPSYRWSIVVEQKDILQDDSAYIFV
jgi:hypothetical protein